MISTRDLSLLPGIEQFKRLLQSLAMLDSIIQPEWEFRYYDFNAHWAKNESIGSMRDGAGNDYFVLFNPAGAILKGFDHESVMSPYQFEPPRVWPGILDDVPEVFSAFLSEPAVAIINTTFCIWRTYSDIAWQRGKIQFPDTQDPDGSVYLLALFDGNPQSYQKWAEDNYKRPVSLAAIRHIYEHRPLTQEVVKLLNDKISFAAVSETAIEIGY